MSADILSKMYWSKLGLLGFFEMTPTIVGMLESIPMLVSNEL